MCLVILYILPAGICIVVFVHSGQTNSWHVLACIYLSLWGWGRRHENILLWWQQVVCSVWGSAGSDGISYGSRSRWLSGVDCLVRAACCAQTYTYPHTAALARLVWSLKGCYCYVMQYNLGKIIAATLHTLHCRQFNAWSSKTTGINMLL